jgi:hypothetical protein
MNIGGEGQSLTSTKLTKVPGKEPERRYLIKNCAVAGFLSYMYNNSYTSLQIHS